MRKIRRFLAGILSASMIMSSMSMATMANELNTETETAIYETLNTEENEAASEVLSQEEAISDSESETEGLLTETETATSTETETESGSETETLSQTEDVELEADNLQNNIEFHVADAYAFEYTDDDIKTILESEYSPEELAGSPEEIELAESFNSESEVAAYLKTQMRNRVESFTFTTPSSIDYRKCIARAYDEETSNNPKDGDYIRANFIGYSMSCTYGSHIPYTYSMTFKYTATSAQEAAVDREVKNLVNSLGLNTSKSQYEKIKSIHDYLVNSITYVNDGTYECHGAYAALIKHQCVCQGYAAALHRLCREAGINSRYIVGDEINHAWNIVRINDEGSDLWYNIDATWDDPSDYYSTRYFLKNDLNFLDHPRNAEFRTKAFEMAHPMSLYSYGVTDGGLDLANLDYSFTSIDGELLSSHAENGNPKLLIFYRNTCGNSIATIKSLSSSLPVKYDRLDIIAIEVDGASEQSIRNFANDKDSSKKIKFTRDNSNAYRAYMNLASKHYSTLPFTIMIDENDRFQFINSGSLNGSTVNQILMKYLLDGWNPYATELKSISLNRASMRLGIRAGEAASEQLSLIYNPDDCINRKVAVFTSSDESVAKVDENGLVTAVSPGTAVITASCAGKTAKCNVTVVSYVDNIKIKDNKSSSDSDDNKKQIYAGETIELSLVRVPYNAYAIGEIRWSLSDNAPAELTVKDEGYTVRIDSDYGISEQEKITVTASLDNKSASYELTVIPSRVVFNANGGSIAGSNSIYEAYAPYDKFGPLPLPDEREGYIFAGWKTEPDTYTGPVTYVSEDTIVNGNWTLYADWDKNETDKMWARAVGAYTYTGAAIKPKVMVYDGDTLLSEGYDYTLSYKNNKNAYEYTEGQEGFDAKKAPTVIIKGKKNYNSSLMLYFQIGRKDVVDTDISVATDLLTKVETNKAQKLIPAVKMGNIPLKNKTDFTVEYPDEGKKTKAYQAPGQYDILLKGNGNYKGERHVSMQITDKSAINIKKASVKNLKNYEYTGHEIEQDVTGNKPFAIYNGKNKLIEGYDYTLTYSNNWSIGTASILITGIGDYTGTKQVNFKITGRNIAKAKLNKEALNAVQFDGFYKEPEVELTYAEKGVTETLSSAIKSDGSLPDYIINYENNRDVGMATIIIKGCGKYTGTIKKKFRITPYKVESAVDENIKVGYYNESNTVVYDRPIVEYSKAGAKPNLSVTYSKVNADGKTYLQTLYEGRDFTVTCANNKKVYELDESDPAFYEKNGKTKAPSYTIKFKNNLSGKLTGYYKIKTSSLKDTATLTIPDITYKAVAGKWVSMPVITDKSGKKLAIKTDYLQDIEYRYVNAATMSDGSTRAANDLVSKTDIPMPGTEIEVTVKGCNSYSGELKGNYRILDLNRDIKGITFTVADKYYNKSTEYSADGIVITKDDISFKASKAYEGFGKDSYEIVPGSYSKNRYIGMASVTLRGINGYGGTKVVKFRVKAKSIK